MDGQGTIVGACNGCINTNGMYVRFDSKERDRNGKCSYDTSSVSHNNGLGPTLEILEKMYKDPSFPPRSPVMSLSLFDQGISRADFWAFATISAVEYGIEMNNIMCDDPDHLFALDKDFYSYDTSSGTSGIHRHGSIHQGESDCKVSKECSLLHLEILFCLRYPNRTSTSPLEELTVFLHHMNLVCQTITLTTKKKPRTIMGTELQQSTISRIILG